MFYFLTTVGTMLQYPYFNASIHPRAFDPRSGRDLIKISPQREHVADVIADARWKTRNNNEQ